jgi:hypothetical protein
VQFALRRLEALGSPAKQDFGVPVKLPSLRPYPRWRDNGRARRPKLALRLRVTAGAARRQRSLHGGKIIGSQAFDKLNSLWQRRRQQIPTIYPLLRGRVWWSSGFEPEVCSERRSLA